MGISAILGKVYFYTIDILLVLNAGGSVCNYFTVRYTGRWLGFKAVIIGGILNGLKV